MSRSASSAISPAPIGLGISTPMAPPRDGRRTRLPDSSPQLPSTDKNTDSQSTDVTSSEPQSSVSSPPSSTTNTPDRGANDQAADDLEWFHRRYESESNEAATSENEDFSVTNEETAIPEGEQQSPCSPPSSPLLTEAPTSPRSPPLSSPASLSSASSSKSLIGKKRKSLDDSPSNTNSINPPRKKSRFTPKPQKKRKRKVEDTTSSSDSVPYFSSSDSTSSKRPSKNTKKSVHWPVPDNILGRNNKHRGVVTSIERIPSVIYGVHPDQESMLEAFNEASEEVKDALKYLTPSTMRQIAHYLPALYNSSFLFVAQHFRNEARGDGVALPLADERRALKKVLLEFVALLHPSLIFCQDCEAVHSTRSKPKNCASRWELSPPHSTSSFTFKEYQVDVKKIRAGIPVLTKCWRSMKTRKVVHLTSEVCVAELWDSYVAGSDRLLLRAQKWIVVPFGCADEAKAMRNYMRWNPLRNECILCRHMAELHEYAELYDCITANVLLDRPVRCEECALEFQVDALGLGRMGWAMVITSWRDFGRCVSAFDPRFQAHFEEYEGLGFEMAHGKTRPHLSFASQSPSPTPSTPSPPTEDTYREDDVEYWIGPDDEQHEEDDDDATIDDAAIADDATISDDNASTTNVSANQDSDTEADEQDALRPHGWDEDEEGECSDLPLGGIRDMFEKGDFDLHDCFDDEGLRALMVGRAHAVEKVLRERQKNNEKKEEITCDAVVMPRLKRWGGDVEEVVDLYAKVDKVSVSSEGGASASGGGGVEVEEFDEDMEISFDFAGDMEGEDEQEEQDKPAIEIQISEDEGGESEAGLDSNIDPALLDS